MNVLIVDTDKVNIDEANKTFKQCIDKSGFNDWLIIPKDFDIMMDVSVDWMKMIRDKMDEKIKALEE